MIEKWKDPRYKIPGYTEELRQQGKKRNLLENTISIKKTTIESKPVPTKFYFANEEEFKESNKLYKSFRDFMIIFTLIYLGALGYHVYNELGCELEDSDIVCKNVS